MFDKATQIGIIAAGTAIGTGKLSGLLGRMGGAAGKVGVGKMMSEGKLM